MKFMQGVYLEALQNGTPMPLYSTSVDVHSLQKCIQSYIAYVLIII